MMAAFDDFMSAFTYNPETFNEAEFKAAAKAAYDTDLGQVNDIVVQREKTIGELDIERKRLGSENWSLLMKQGIPIPANNDSGAHTASEEEEEAELPTLDSIATVTRK